MKTNHYRNHAISPRDIETFVVAKAIAIPLMEICLSADYHNPEQFRDWLTEWKSVYKKLSTMISEIKYGLPDENVRDKQVALNALKRLANTMLNAREYATDRRRIVRGASK